MVCRANFKLCISDSKTVSFPASRIYHLQHRIDPEDLALGADQASYAQRRLAGTGSNIQNRVSTANQRILDKSIRDRRKHMTDDFAMLLPERSRIAPSVDGVLLGLHEQSIPWAVDAPTGSWTGTAPRGTLPGGHLNRPDARCVIPLKYAAHPGFRILLFLASWSFASSLSLCRQAQPTAWRKRSDFCVRSARCTYCGPA